MSDLRFIVQRLNDAPFNKKLSLVAFDEKSNFELLQILNDVFVEMDSRHDVDLRDEPDEQRGYRMTEFLKLLKYPIPGDHEQFRENISRGGSHMLYPILQWALQNLAIHKKRAYLGRYLAPLQVPQEFLGDDALNDMNDHYKELQQEFKKSHKQVDANRNSSIQPAELRKEITQLEEERQQLKEKISYLKRKSSKEPGFKELMEVTSAFRKQQEEQQKLLDRKHDQEMGVSVSEKRYRAVYQHVQEMKAATSGSVSPDELFDQLSKRVDHNRHLLTAIIPREYNKKKQVLHRLEHELRAPRKTEHDINDVSDEVGRLKQAIEHFNNQITTAQRNSGDDKMAIFRQHATAQNKKLLDKEEELKAAERQVQKLKLTADEMENKLSEISGPKFMKREEFKQYANTLRAKTSEYKKLKAELGIMNAETVVLHRTEQILKGRSKNLEGFLKEMEEKKGTSFAMETDQGASDLTKVMQETKGMSLEEIGKVVADVNQTLSHRKEQLGPKIKELRSVRERFQENEQEYLEKKTVYDNTAVGLETERIKLEQECNAFQDDCLREESRYHQLQCLISIEDAKFEKIKHEMDFEQGNGKLLRDFSTFQDLYKHKISQQESLSKELRKQQKNLKETSTGSVQQRKQFDNLFQLLQVKIKYVGGPEQAEMDAKSEAKQNQDNTFNYGGANVMTIDSY